MVNTQDPLLAPMPGPRPRVSKGQGSRLPPPGALAQLAQPDMDDTAGQGNLLMEKEAKSQDQRWVAPNALGNGTLTG